MKTTIESSWATCDLPAGHQAEPGIYVVSHHEPAHIVPHEVLVEEPILLPACRLCANVRYSLKSALPQRINEHQMLWSVSEETIARLRTMAAEVRTCANAGYWRVEESRERLGRHNGGR